MSKRVSIDGFSAAPPSQGGAGLPQADQNITEQAPPATTDSGFQKLNRFQPDDNTEAQAQFSGEVLPDFGRAAEGIDDSDAKLRKKPRIKPFKLVKRIVLMMVMAVVVVGGYFGFQAAMNLGNVFSGGGSSAVLFGDVKPELLNQEGDGRVNALIVGVGGAGHDGADLADTIMIASLNPFTKQASLISIPRDFYVEYNGEFMRINEVHFRGEQLGEDRGPEEMMSLVEQSFDVPLHYYVRLDFAALEKAVDTLGGIDVNVQNEVYDATVANDFGKPLAFEPGIHNMDGRTALMYSRSRKGSVGGGDFARTERQKEVMQAMFTKGLSKGIFSSPTTVQSLLNNFSDNVKTSLSLGDLMALYGLAKDLDINTIQTATIGYRDQDGNPLLQDYRTSFGAEVLIPFAGIGEMGELINYVKSNMVDSYVEREAPRLAILNASGVGGVAASYEAIYAAMGYNVVEVGNYQEQGILSTTQIVELNAKEYSRNYLLKRFGLDQTQDIAVTQSKELVDYVIILGVDAELE